ncbi:MAG: helix-turn-helix domain-containing protein, partial [Gammaproteobacteria bacterium]|nr:helix-turn-helix domain-containing protein [Gammaproteobacteria bacterium]
MTQEERYQIYAYKKARFSNIQIAEMLSRHVSTIKRELGRNKGQKGYRPQQAHGFAQERHQMKPKAIKMTSAMQQHIREKLSLEWSPEQIQGRLITEGEASSVCPKTIYAFIAQ